jgi:hypothetical protein
MHIFEGMDCERDYCLRPLLKLNILRLDHKGIIQLQEAARKLSGNNHSLRPLIKKNADLSAQSLVLVGVRSLSPDFRTRALAIYS